MSELKALFHTPEELRNNDLLVLQNRIWWQRQMPNFGAVSFGLTYWLFAKELNKRTVPKVSRALAIGAIGYIVGCNAVQKDIAGTVQQFKHIDVDIQRAHEQRWLEKYFQVAGLRSNHTSHHQLQDSTHFTKPY